MGIIEIENLCYRYPDTRRGIEAIHLSVPAGAFVVIVGPNGSGKTTLLKHLNGLLLPDSGSVRIDGMNVSTHAMEARQLVGMVFQDTDSQIVGETVGDDVAFGPENLGLDRKEIHRRASRALAAMALHAHAPQQAYTLSGGEKRRLAIAGILAMEPKILVFDEPFSDLDYPSVKQVLKQIVSLHGAGYTVIVTTHDLEKVIAHAGRLIIMKDGRIVRDGAPNEIVKDVERFGVREPCLSRLGKGIGSWLS